MIKIYWDEQLKDSKGHTGFVAAVLFCIGLSMMPYRALKEFLGSQSPYYALKDSNSDT